MKIYNSLTNKVEEFKPLVDGKVSMYVCGPTVYNHAHIGNMRPVVVFDMVARYFKYLGYDVDYVSNFTDVNPKIISAAKELGITEREVADRFIEAYLEMNRLYNCDNVNSWVKVIDSMDDIYNFITKLIEKDMAYEVDGDVYFRVSDVKDYGVLSNQDREELISGSRVDIDEKKENPMDFALWRKTTEGEVFESPWGLGIPGWHTECVVMINKVFGKKIDIHAGGIDLIFPHHENEVAQSIALNDNYLANYWMHNGHINLDNQKMSKSLGNFILAKDFIKMHNANEIKIAMFKTHYRLPLNFTDELFDEALKTDEKIYNALKQANVMIQVNDLEINKIKSDSRINEVMDEDFNTPNLITLLLELLKELNNAIRGNGELAESFDKVLLVTNILGLKYDLVKMSDEDINDYKTWKEFIKNKDFENGDILRNKLIEKGII